MLLAAVLAVGHLFATPSLWPVDETAHIAYAESLTRNLAVPRIDDPLPVGAAAAAIPGLPERLSWERSQQRDGRQDIWVANHPPAAYAVQGIAYRAGGALDGLLGTTGTLAVGFARATSVAWLVLGVWATAQLAFVLAGASPRRRHRTPPEQVAVGAALLVAVTPTLSNLAGLTFTDVPAFTTSTLCLLVGVRAALLGVTPRRMTALGLLIGLTLAVRTSSLPAAGVAGLLGLYGWYRTPDGPSLRAMGAPIGIGLAALLPAVVWGLRNRSLYGSITASEYLLAKFDRDINGATSEVLRSFDSWLRLGTRMMADLTTGHWNTGTRRDVVQVVLTLICGAGLWWLFTTVDAARKRRADASDTDGASSIQGETSPGWGMARAMRLIDAIADRPLQTVWTLMALVPAALAVAALQFHASGGSLHGRYVLSGHAIVMIAAAVWLTRLHRFGGLAVTVTAGLLALVDISLIWGVYLEHSSNWDRTTISIELPYLAGSATPFLLGLLSLAATVLFAVVATGVLRLAPSVSEAGDQTVSSVVGVDDAAADVVQ